MGWLHALQLIEESVGMNGGQTALFFFFEISQSSREKGTSNLPSLTLTLVTHPPTPLARMCMFDGQVEKKIPFSGISIFIPGA